jgi:hypothetical protein
VNGGVVVYRICPGDVCQDCQRINSTFENPWIIAMMER